MPEVGGKGRIQTLPSRKPGGLQLSGSTALLPKQSNLRIERGSTLNYIHVYVYLFYVCLRSYVCMFLYVCIYLYVYVYINQMHITYKSILHSDGYTRELKSKIQSFSLGGGKLHHTPCLPAVQDPRGA